MILKIDIILNKLKNSLKKSSIYTISMPKTKRIINQIKKYSQNPILLLKKYENK